jgi:hypothetical protein
VVLPALPQECPGPALALEIEQKTFDVVSRYHRSGAPRPGDEVTA